MVLAQRDHSDCLFFPFCKRGLLAVLFWVQKRGKSLPRAAIASPHLKTPCTPLLEGGSPTWWGWVSQLEGDHRQSPPTLPPRPLDPPTLKKPRKSTGYKVMETVPTAPMCTVDSARDAKRKHRTGRSAEHVCHGHSVQTNNKRDPRGRGGGGLGLVGLVPSLKSLDEPRSRVWSPLTLSTQPRTWPLGGAQAKRNIG